MPRKPRKTVTLPPLPVAAASNITQVQLPSGKQISIQILSPEEATEKKNEALQIWRKARILANIAMDIYTPAISALIPVPVIDPGMPTMGVDPYYRCYFSPMYVAELVENAKAVSKANPCAFCGATSHHELAYVAGDIYHESQHCLRQHGKRSKSFIANNNIKDENWQRNTNIAADMEIDDDAKQLFAEVHAYNVTKRINSPQLCYRKNEHTVIPLPQDMGLEVNHIMEFYYRNLPQDIKDKMNGKGSGKDGQGNGPGTRKCGSGATGVQQSYELGAPGDGEGESPGIDDVDQKEIQKAVAKLIQEAVKTRGEGAIGAMLEWANEILPPPVYDWRRELTRSVLIGISRIHGHRHRDFNNPAKKSAATNFDVVYPKYFARLPRIRIVLDTSGSMYSRGKDALIEIEGICKAARAHVDLFCVDWDVYDKQAVRSARDIKLKGGGGTSMKRGIEQIMGNHKTREMDMMVLVTDGETDYPDKATMKGVPLIVACINESPDIIKSAPNWTTNVYVPVDGKRK